MIPVSYPVSYYIRAARPFQQEDTSLHKNYSISFTVSTPSAAVKRISRPAKPKP